ncbi:CAZyme family GT90 [Paecilomyces variotii]|nr:CAZyme family GT90 [Paecilomyces variotii]KAJ9205225.1 CAZyme family GT90 [Paecilomyces variotii]KAJ9255753.1 CAZyme family GT90 [Paecilomyces variotii]KAJ9280262.1 CAZyme family GT90 [Paecilomyces variotii]KAJ9343076.1 CAZyme family GT90 [Paecilomyces variotii]
MHALSRSLPSRRGSALLHLLGCFAFASGLLIFVMWFGMNSDRDRIPPLLTQLIPAGHCTCTSSTIFQCDSCLSCAASDLSVNGPAPSKPHWKFQYGRDDQNEGLDRAQCQVAFPGLFEDVSRATNYWREHGGITVDDLDAIPLQYGMARAFIHKGELYVVAARAKGEDHRRKIVATLSSIHRALVASPDRAFQPDLEFIFSIEDRVDDVVEDPDHPIWVLARKPTEQAVWLMPDFGFWAWDNLYNTIGPYDQVVDRIKKLDIPWSEKKKQLVWRGKPSFAPKLRRALMDAARGKPWDDVKPIDWYKKTNVIKMEDHCHYMFIAHVEGRSYSASLKYRQACRSVVVAHKLQYIQHHHYLLVSSGPNQNFVEVERNFTDLAEKIDPLVANPALAERIADNSVKTFRERYLTQAAEACYWRALFDGYARVSNQNVTLWSEKDQKARGLRYESFVMLESRLMYEFSTSVSSQWYI